MRQPTVHPHIRGAYSVHVDDHKSRVGSSPHTWGIRGGPGETLGDIRFIPTYVGHTALDTNRFSPVAVHPHIRGAYAWPGLLRRSLNTVHPHIRGAYRRGRCPETYSIGSSPHTWGIHWIAVRKMAGFSHFSYDFTRKSYFVQGLVFFGVIGAEAFPTHRRGRSQCLPGAHGGSVRNL